MIDSQILEYSAKNGYDNFVEISRVEVFGKKRYSDGCETSA